MPDDVSTLGIEWDATIASTAKEAGFNVIVADVSALDPSIFAPIDGLVGSPPCQAYSVAGKGLGRQDRPLVEAAARDLAAGRDTRAEWAARMQDERSILTVEPLRYALELRPRFIALEQVPAVLPLWELFAELLAEHGYHAVAGILSAEQYGAPQTRKRAYLIASLDGPVSLPAPTHQKYKKGEPAMLKDGLKPWVSMAEALGWGMTERPSYTVTGGGTGRGGAEPFGKGARQQMNKAEREGRWLVNGKRRNAAVQRDDEPSPTITAGHDYDSRRIVSDTRSRPLTVEEASILMGFPPDFPWQGSRTMKFLQIGNAVVPVVARAVVREAMAPTRAGHDYNNRVWQKRHSGPGASRDPRPSTDPSYTIRASGSGAAPGGVKWVLGDFSERKLTVEEASILMGFPVDFPWQGSRSKKFLQIGNAVVPAVVRRVVEEAMRPTRALELREAA